MTVCSATSESLFVYELHEAELHGDLVTIAACAIGIAAAINLLLMLNFWRRRTRINAELAAWVKQNSSIVSLACTAGVLNIECLCVLGSRVLAKLSALN